MMAPRRLVTMAFLSVLAHPLHAQDAETVLARRLEAQLDDIRSNGRSR